MKKWLKITLISLGSLLGVVVIAVAVAMYLVFTPARLTSIVNDLADDYILCENSFEKVGLKLFRTFPNAGLDVKNVVLVNPHAGVENDTVAMLRDLTVAINVKEFLKHKNIKVEQVLIDGVEANLVVDSIGGNNFSIFKIEEKDEEDTTAMKLPETIDIKKVKLDDLNCMFSNQQKNIDVMVNEVRVDVKGSLRKSIADANMDVRAKHICVVTNDTLLAKEIMTDLKEVKLNVEGAGDIDGDLKGDIRVSVDDGNVRVNGVDYVTDAMREKREALVAAEIPFRFNKGKIYTVEAGFALTEFGLKLTADVELPSEEHELIVNSDFTTAQWDVAELLRVLPEQNTLWAKDMTIGALLQFQGHLHYSQDTISPSAVSAHVIVDKGKFKAPKIMHYDLSKVGADMEVYIGLAKQPSWVEIGKLEAHSGENMVKLNGRIDDLLGGMDMNVKLNSRLKLDDLHEFYPDSLPLITQGYAQLNLRARTNLEQLKRVDVAKMRVSGSIDLSELDVMYDSINVTSDHLGLYVDLPAKRKLNEFKEMISAEVNSGDLHANIPTAKLVADLRQSDILVTLSDFMDTTKPLCVGATFNFAKLKADMDTISAEINGPHGRFTMIPNAGDKSKVKYDVKYNSRTILANMGDGLKVNLGGLSISGSADYDSTRSNVLKQWSPNLDIAVMRGAVEMKDLPYMLQMPDFKFNYQPEVCEISNANIVFGNSDYYLTGKVNGLEDWISHEGMLRGDLYFTSNYTNVDDLMDVLSGLGSDKDTLEAQREAEHVAKEANPFIVPKDVDFTLHTNIREVYAFDNELQSLAGDVHICDGVAVLDQVGFVCKAAKMQLTAMYKSPRPNHLFLGMDFHLLDIEIDELIDMIPYVDTLIPMLNSFSGDANFHLAAETYLNAYYQPKMSTMRGAAAITAKDLVVLDNETFNKIAKLMMFKKKTENKFDSLDVEMTLFKKEIEMYPSMLSMDKYNVCVSGFQSLDNACNYHLEILKSPLPVRLAVNVKGIKPFKIGLGKVQYANMYKPEKRNAVQAQTLELKNMIKKSLESNVRESTKEMKKEGN